MARDVNLTIFSGTIDILQLPYKENNIEKQKRAFLDQTYQKLPVPKFFFKVILDETIRDGSKQGIVFLGKLFNSRRRLRSLILF